MLRTFFSKQPKEGEVPKIGKAQRGIPYDQGLITALTHQHRELVMLLVKASSAAELGYYDETEAALGQFKTDLARHLRRESIELMPYLAAHLRGDDAKGLLREMHTNGALIERTVKSFLDHYLLYPVTAVSMQGFQIEIDGLSEEFSQEVEREEAAFYTLYMAPEAY